MEEEATGPGIDPLRRNFLRDENRRERSTLRVSQFPLANSVLLASTSPLPLLSSLFLSLFFSYKLCDLSSRS